MFTEPPTSDRRSHGSPCQRHGSPSSCSPRRVRRACPPPVADDAGASGVPVPDGARGARADRPALARRRGLALPPDRRSRERRARVRGGAEARAAPLSRANRAGLRGAGAARLRRALTAFDAALEPRRAYVPALVGRGQALLASDRTEPALEAFEAALAARSLADRRARRVEVLRFRNVQDVIEAAQAAAAEGRVDEARRALRAGALDLARQRVPASRARPARAAAGNADRALEHLRRAVELDPADAVALVETGRTARRARQMRAGRRGCLPEGGRHRPQPEPGRANRGRRRARARVASAGRISRGADGCRRSRAAISRR